MYDSQAVGFLCTQKLPPSALRRKRFGAIVVYTETSTSIGQEDAPVWTQKPPSTTTRSVARPKTGETPIQHVRIPAEDWDELGRKGAGLVRDFIRWYLRRPGAKLPVRPPVASPTTDGEVDE